MLKDVRPEAFYYASERTQSNVCWGGFCLFFFNVVVYNVCAPPQTTTATPTKVDNNKQFNGQFVQPVFRIDQS